MADPMTIMAGVGMAGSAVQGIMGAFGAEKSGGANAARDNYLAGVAQINAKIDRDNAAKDLQEGAITGEMAGLRSAQTIADTKAKAGASGFIVGSGSNAEVTADQEKAAAYDQELIAYKTQRLAYGDLTKAGMSDAQGNMYKMAAGNDAEAGDLNALSSVIGGATNVASKWTQWNSITNGSPIGRFSNGGNDGAAPTWS